MCASNGKELSGIDHLKQSIIDILTTPIGSRVMRRDYGSRLFELIDKPLIPGFAMEVYAATAEALQKWEQRFKLERIQVIEIKKATISLSLEGTYLPTGKQIILNDIMV
jgi:hypothetical protein